MLRWHREEVWAYSTVDMIASGGLTTVSLRRDTVLPWLRTHSWVQPTGKPSGGYLGHFPKLKMTAHYISVVFFSFVFWVFHHLVLSKEDRLLRRLSLPVCCFHCPASWRGPIPKDPEKSCRWAWQASAASWPVTWRIWRMQTLRSSRCTYKTILLRRDAAHFLGVRQRKPTTWIWPLWWLPSMVRRRHGPWQCGFLLQSTGETFMRKLRGMSQSGVSGRKTAFKKKYDKIHIT